MENGQRAGNISRVPHKASGAKGDLRTVARSQSRTDRGARPRSGPCHAQCTGQSAGPGTPSRARGVLTLRCERCALASRTTCRAVPARRCCERQSSGQLAWRTRPTEGGFQRCWGTPYSAAETPSWPLRTNERGQRRWWRGGQRPATIAVVIQSGIYQCRHQHACGRRHAPARQSPAAAGWRARPAAVSRPWLTCWCAAAASTPRAPAAAS